MEDLENTQRRQIFTVVGNMNSTSGIEVRRRLGGTTPKDLTPLSIMKTDFVNVYNNKHIGDVLSYDIEKHDQNCFRRSMSFFMIIAQCFALCPVRGMRSSHIEDLRFDWRSWHVLYCLIIPVGIMILMGFSIVFYIKGNFNFEIFGAVMFYSIGFLCCISFFNLSRKWPQLEKLWQRTEYHQMKYGHPNNLYLKVKVITIVTLVVALGEHLLAKYTVFIVAVLCSKSTADIIKLYYIMDFRYIFEFIHFSIPAAVLCEVLNIFAAFYWNFVDLFVVIVSLSLSSRFRQLNNHLKTTMGKMKTEEFWRNAREDYNRLSILTKFLDSCISSIVLLSFATNMFYICQQLYNTLKKSIGMEKMIYFFVSFGYLMFRTIAVSLCAASIYDESKASKDVLYAVPTQSYRIEVHRFLLQISTDTVALTGLKFFTVTRMLLLTLGGTVVTYVVVMVQFSNSSESQSTNLTYLCFNLTEKNLY